MAKIICLGLNGGLIDSNTYTTPKGNQYNFQKGIPLEVKDKDDVKFFLDCGNGELFKEVKVTEKITEKVKEAVTGKKEGPELYTEEELYALDKKEQEELIKKFGGKLQAIPRYEKHRVALLLKLEATKPA